MKPKQGRGRPPIDPSATEPSTPITVTLPARDYHDARRVANEQRQTVQDLIRRSLRQMLHYPR